MTTTKKFTDFLKSNKDRFKIGVRTLQIFGTADTALSVGAAKLGNAYLSDGRLELLEGVSHWVHEESPIEVERRRRGLELEPEIRSTLEQHQQGAGRKKRQSDDDEEESSDDPEATDEQP